MNIIYGFEGEPFRLPKFTSRRLFALEYLRQRLNVENDNFLKNKKASTMKLNFTLEPFVVKSISTILVIDQILRSMSFEHDKALRYDPNKVIHQRRLDLNIRGYESFTSSLLSKKICLRRSNLRHTTYYKDTA